MVNFDHISEIGRLDKAIKHATGNQEWNIGHKKAYDGFPTPLWSYFGGLSDMGIDSISFTPY